MTFDALKDKALSLPLEPGVYIMRDKTDRVIYVGKAKKLKNRVSQYFQDTANHTPKTRLMVSKIDHFDVIVAASEFDALVLECSLIKRHQPKYNILLKDDKGYPYIRLNMKDAYPQLSLVSKITNDGVELTAESYGEVSILIPAFHFDGKDYTVIKSDEKSVLVEYKGSTCTYTTNGTVSGGEKIYANRNGYYKGFETHAYGSVTLKISINSAEN